MGMQANINQDSTGAANGTERLQGPEPGQNENGGSGPGGPRIEHRQIITQRIVKDQEKVDQFFNEKAEQLKNIASYQK